MRFGAGNIRYIAVNKHRPWTVLRSSGYRELVRLAHRVPRGRSMLQKLVDRPIGRMADSCFDDCDLIIQCGAPVFTKDCDRAEWGALLWHGTLSRIGSRIPVLNLAAGSCFPWDERESPPVTARTGEHIRRMHGICRATTVRDYLARQVCASLGLRVELIPCSALLSAPAVPEFRKKTRGERLSLLINYMHSGGHYSWGRPVDSAGWERTVREFVNRMSPRYRIRFLCHNSKEENLARGLWPQHEIVMPATAEQYHAVLGEVDAALCNRLHAAVALASIGVPSVAVGSDTRLLMVGQLNLPIHFVDDVSADSLEEEIEHLIAIREQERERLLALKEHTRSLYRRVLETTSRPAAVAADDAVYSGRSSVSAA